MILTLPSVAFTACSCLSFSPLSSIFCSVLSLQIYQKNRPYTIVYTYTNTSRSGNLSFKILIDHPSIINQWRGIVKGGNGIGDVDDIHSNEQQLLRFFAGCDILKAKPQKYYHREPIVKKEDKKVEKKQIIKGFRIGSTWKVSKAAVDQYISKNLGVIYAYFIN